MVRSTYWIGRPPPAPGRDGGAKTKACTPAFSFRRFWISCLVAAPFFSRSLHSFSLKPTKPPPPPSMPTIRKRVVDLRDLLAGIGELPGEGLRVIGGRVFRRVDEAEIGALILFRRELGRRLREQEDRRAEEHGDDDERHGRGNPASP